MKANTDSWLDAEKHFKKKVRKPKRIKTKYNHAYCHNDNFGKHVDIGFQSATIKQAKILQIWLTKAIKYLEQK